MAGDQELMVQPTDFQFDMSDEELLGYYLKRDLYSNKRNGIYKQSSSAFGKNKRTLAESIVDTDLVRSYNKKQRWGHYRNLDASISKGDLGEGATEGQESFSEQSYACSSSQPPPNQISSSDDAESQLTDFGSEWENLFELVGLWSRELFDWMKDDIGPCMRFDVID